MRNLNILLSSIFILVSLNLFAQEPTVKIMAKPEGPRKDQIILKNGVHIMKRITQLKEGEYVRLGRKNFYKWNEIEAINLSKGSLLTLSPNYGERIPIHYDSTLVKDKILMKNGTVIEGTIYDFIQFYIIKVETGPLKYSKPLWTDIKEVYLGNSSPFVSFANDPESTTNPQLANNTDLKTPQGETTLKQNRYEYKLTYYKPLSTDQIRKSWQIRGGQLFCAEYNVAMSILHADGFTGFGFSYGGAFSLISLKPPIFSDGISNTSAFKLGANFSANNMVLKITGGSGSMQDFTFGLNLGYQMGFGKFFDSKDWRGIMVGAAWRPTFQFTSTNFTFGPYQISSHDTNTNMSGYEFYVNFANLKSITSRFVKPAHMKLSLFILPPIGDTKMSFVMIGFGMVSY
jgi:hypothetical protein